MATFLIIVGLLGLLISLNLVYKKMYTAQLSLNPVTKKIKEHGHGLTWKWFFCPLQKPEINMRASIIITSGGILLMSWDKFMSEKVYEKITSKIYETQDSVLYGSWATAIRPAKGLLKKFILKTPQVGALMTMSEIDITVSDALAKRLTGDVLGDKRAISEMIGKIFGGNDEKADSNHEKTYGIIVSRPRLFDLSFGKKSQDAAEKLFEAKKFREAMEDLKGEITDPDKRSDAIFIANGMVKKNIINIEGLEGATKNIADAFLSFFAKKS